MGYNKNQHDNSNESKKHRREVQIRTFKESLDKEQEKAVFNRYQNEMKNIMNRQNHSANSND